MSISNLTAIINNGINDPNCSFFVGHFVGESMSLQYLLVIVLVFAILKAVDKLAYEPFIEYIKKKLYRVKSK